MQYFRLLFLSVTLLALSVPQAWAQARSWDVDAVHSNVYFSIDHIFSKVHGRFTDVEAALAFDPDDLQASSLSYTIKVGSVETGESKRDKHLLSSDFFDAGKYKTITFVSRSITDAGNGLYNVAGTLRVKGKSHELVLPLQLAGVKDHPAAKGKEVIGFNGTLSLDRLALNVGSGAFYTMGLIGKDVDVLVTIEALSDKE
ncbi:polyisoprenoid-binding protein [Desulfobulbus rhabdoformis]|uniref:YceI family protein n=1 Tax=Desulfobulbus rhabdoformis TaxID=34032 RepID=UPI0019664AA6|nr:YceI family protein [Desulfobulbus rhabdoformis]MBM9614702.1 polyisoprenoid-binding protein [Desulfobulbus rhabdoformis]